VYDLRLFEAINMSIILDASCLGLRKDKTLHWGYSMPSPKSYTTSVCAAVVFVNLFANYSDKQYAGYLRDDISCF
jgi:hypothetical protein